MSKWLRLYPKSWREEYGDEFEATIEQITIGPKEAFDIVWNALRVRSAAWPRQILFCLAWLLVGWLNAFGNEVQWAVGGLLLTCAVSTASRPKRWIASTLFFFSAVPVSTLVAYQFRELRHDMFYQTIIALIPATIGSVCGLMLGSLRPSTGTPA